MYDPMKEPDGMRELLVTPATAQFWLSRYRYPDNRTVSEATVRRWAALMAANRWRVSNLDFFRNAEDDAVYLCNGHRRLLAVIKADKAVPFRACIGTLPTFEDVRQQYLTYDDPNAVRRLNEVIGGTALAVLGVTFTNQMRAAVALILDDFCNRSGRQRNMPVGIFAEQIKCISEWIPEFEIYRPLLPPTTETLRKGLVAAPVMGVALATLRYDREAAEDFWCRVSGDDGLERGTPEWLANRYIRESGFNRGINAGYRARYVATCWNATKQGRAISKAYPNVARPIQILGTPWKG